MRFLDGFRTARSDESPREGRRLPIIDRDSCTGCGSCVAACEQRALSLVWDFATLVRADACSGEGRCVEACPEGCIRMAHAGAAAGES